MSQLRHHMANRAAGYLDDALYDSSRLVMLETKHAIVVRQMAMVSQDCTWITVHCVECGQQWSTRWIPTMTIQESKQQITDVVVPLFCRVLEADCFSLADKQQLAEYVTNRLVEAGPAGMSLNALIRGLVTDTDAPRGNVVQAIDALAFEDFRMRFMVPQAISWETMEPENALTVETREEIWLRLPRGHPLREW